jgi:hypothetical protein
MLAAAGSHDVRNTNISLSFCVETLVLVLTPLISVINPDCRVYLFRERNLWCHIFCNNGEFYIYHSYSSFLNDYQLVIATTVNLLVYALPTGSLVPSPKGKAKGKSRKGKSSTRQTSLKLELTHTVDLPVTLAATVGGSFRAAR